MLTDVQTPFFGTPSDSLKMVSLSKLQSFAKRSGVLFMAMLSQSPVEKDCNRLSKMIRWLRLAEWSRATNWWTVVKLSTTTRICKRWGSRSKVLSKIGCMLGRASETLGLDTRPPPSHPWWATDQRHLLQLWWSRIRRTISLLRLSLLRFVDSKLLDNFWWTFEFQPLNN